MIVAAWLPAGRASGSDHELMSVPRIERSDMAKVRYSSSSFIVAAAAAVLVFVAAASSSEASCSADVDSNGVVGITDFLRVIGEWGLGSGTSDFTGPDDVADGVVDVFDFLGVLGAWGPCPEP